MRGNKLTPPKRLPLDLAGHRLERRCESSATHRTLFFAGGIDNTPRLSSLDQLDDLFQANYRSKIVDVSEGF